MLLIFHNFLFRSFYEKIYFSKFIIGKWSNGTGGKLGVHWY
ncbi:hypothetical protein AO385_0642 [Moraxella catarrhalis]|nr:hypothetical protein AO385_0642 [Moraxella catarrhalis]